jgi:hypothetical protein
MNDFTNSHAGASRCLTAVELFDLGFGPQMIPVSPPDAQLAPGSTIRFEDRGKAPARKTPGGDWVGYPWQYGTCPDRKTAETWDSWGANVGVRADGYVIVFDNDFGRVVTRILEAAFSKRGINPLRRLRTGSDRCAFLVRARDPIEGKSATMKFSSLRFGPNEKDPKLEVFAHNSKQLVVAGRHPSGGEYHLDRAIRYNQIPMIDEARHRVFRARIVGGRPALLRAQRVGHSREGCRLLRQAPGGD